MSTADPIRVCVVGGSIAGCAVAIELARIGLDVTIFERTGDQLKDRGAGIGIPRSAFDTYVDRDLVDREIAYFPAESFTRIWRSETAADYGYVAWDQPAQLAALNWGELYRNLRARVPDRAYCSEHRVATIDGRDDGVTLTLADGDAHEFDLVVCADGYASLGRKTMFPDVDVRYAGYVLWRGFIDESALTESAPLATGIKCIGFPGGHGIFYFVPGVGGTVAPGQRLVNWGMYVPVADDELAAFMTDKSGVQHEGSLPPGGMPLATENILKRDAEQRLPRYYADIAAKSMGTFAYAIYDCEVPAYAQGRLCLAGDAGAFARPHSAAGALKGMNDAVALGAAINEHDSIDAALAAWNAERTAVNNGIVRYGNQLGQALVKAIPDWSQMSEADMQTWFSSIVTIETDYISSERRTA